MKAVLEKIHILSSSEKKKLLATATVVFDTNALLQLYRYSTKTRESAFEIISSYKDRLFEPFQVCFEFSKLHKKIIDEERTEVTTLTTEIKNFFSKIKSVHDDWIFKDTLRASSNSLVKEIEKIGKTKEDFSRNDSVLAFCEKVFLGKVSNPKTAREKLELCDIAKKRYEHKIAPGYKDNGKKYNPYGDYFIWNDIIQYAKDNCVDIIFVSNDTKEDWGEEGHLKSELIIEFNTETHRKIDYYTLESFLKQSAAQNTDIDMPKPVKKELKSWDKATAALISYYKDLLPLAVSIHTNNIISKKIAFDNLNDVLLKQLEREVNIYNEHLSRLENPSLKAISEYSKKW